MEGLRIAEQRVRYNKTWRSSPAELHVELAPNHVIKSWLSENIYVEYLVILFYIVNCQNQIAP